MNTASQVQISAETTPNPNTLKFVVNKTFFEFGSMDFPDKEKAQESPLASKLFDIPSVAGVFIGTNFITVTKTTEADWNTLITPVVNTIRALLSTGEAVTGTGKNTETKAEGAGAKAADPVETKIREILDREIRPAVAMDGGDIVFLKYEDGVVTLHLRGSCSACPSSVMTLKMGVENRLKAEVPGVKEVVQV